MKMTSFILILAGIAVCNSLVYDEEVAKELGAFAFGAYCSNDAIESWQTGYVSETYPDLTRLQVVENVDMGTKSFVAYNKKQNAITVVFRGSNNPTNWIEDLTFVKTPFIDACNCKVHQGFNAAYTSLKILIDLTLPEYRIRYPTAHLHVSGHSLGGAMATLLASEIASFGFKVTLVTLGSPRVGDSDFYDWMSTLKVTHFRIVNEKDMAPHLPPQAFSFQHVNTEVWYTDGTYRVCQEVKGEDKTCSISVKNTNMSDHSNYIGMTYAQC